ncbi:hypothetical protein BpHYR1_032601 [Brachionus plicatilis]|uniref:Uncharacterized protein n=1 Tax=Brachionus plicatilis TaxID=10195 RepID=A0A3M7QYN2_BRAPC|nr:hypothetical protein BpHYR1_032601 [Brachionus plicatilis]
MQSMWRHIQDTGLTTVYRTSSKHRFLLKLPLILAFCPSHDVETNFNIIKKKLDPEDPNTSKIEEFYTYLEETYVGSTKMVKESSRRNARMIEQRSEPMFEKKLWTEFMSVFHVLIILSRPGITLSLKSHHSKLDERLKNIISQYKKDNFEQFYVKISTWLFYSCYFKRANLLPALINVISNRHIHCMSFACYTHFSPLEC